MGAVPQWSIVVPAKRLAVAKTRLRPLTTAFGGTAHDELVLALLADTVAAAVACPSVAEVVVVTDDPDAADVVRAFGARTVADEPDRGLNPALEHGARNASCPAVAALSSDLPGAARRRARCRAPRGGGGSAVLRPRRPRHRDDAAHGARHGAAPPVRAGLGAGAPGRRRASPWPATGPGWSGTSTPRPTCRTRWPSAPARGRRHSSRSAGFRRRARPFRVGHDDRVPTASASRTGSLPADRYLNRELSWLDFNARVLELAEDDSLPLLERMKFLAIFAGNLDEFFMVRIAGLKRRHDMGLTVRSPDGLTIREQLELVTRRTQDLVQRHANVFLKDVAPRLEDEGIRIVHYEDLEDDAARRLREYFRDQVFPVLTPLAVDPAHPFPYISGLSLNLAVSVRDPDSGVAHFARVKVPNNVPRFVPVGPTGQTATFLPLEDLIAAHLPQLFPGLEVVSHHLFRVTRNADMEVEEDRDEDLLQALERELSRRRFGPAVRLEVTDTMDPQILEVLLSEMEMRPEDVLHVPGLLDLAALGRSTTWTGPSSRTTRSCRPPTPGSRRARRPRASSRPSARATSSSTTRTTPSPRACSGSSSRPPPIRTSWRSSRRSTAPRATPRSSTP